jgi:DNA-binding response OmpR family regulator
VSRVQPIPGTILIVEHDQTTIDTYARILRVEGYAVQTAVSATAALHDAAALHPAAILVDFHMPDMEGLEFVRRLRASEERSHTPLAIVTGDLFLDERVPAALRELGAAVWFKPLWQEELVALVHRLVDGPGEAPV